MSEERTITIDDVARLAGVSRATAGRVVGNYGSVSDKAKERVLEAVRQLDYQPNLIARGLRSQSTKTIAVVIGSIRNTYSTALVYAVEKEAQKKRIQCFDLYDTRRYRKRNKAFERFK